MHIHDIVDRINKALAGEALEYHEIEPFLDEVIDDINAKLNSRFPVFSEFTVQAYPGFYPNYAFFPEEYIRKVVIKGAAFKFYTMDEEGMQAAAMYGYDYTNALFEMLRDYVDLVPYQFRRDSIDPGNKVGSVKLHENGFGHENDKWIHPVAIDFRRIDI